MKVIVLLLCAVAGASAGHAVAWPGAIPLTTAVKTIIPPQIKAFGYSTSQYINALPAGYHPQFGYQISVPSYHQYQPVVSTSYFPSNGIYYPSLAPAAPAPPISPIFPIGTINPVDPASPTNPPEQNVPVSSTEQPAGDEDSAVIEAADSNSNQQQPSEQQSPDNFPQTSLDSKNMPGRPQIPQATQQFPFFPQFIQQGANFPPQHLELQQNPTFPQAPSSSPSFPSADNTDKGLDDEDTITVESA